MIYGVSLSIEQEETNTLGEEDECFFHKCLLNYRNLGSNVIKFISNKCIRIKNWNQKPNPILKSRDENVCPRKIQEGRNHH